MRYSFRTLILVFLFLSILVGGIGSEIHSQLLEKQKLKLGHMQIETITKILDDLSYEYTQSLPSDERLSGNGGLGAGSPTSHLYFLAAIWIQQKKKPPPKIEEPKYYAWYVVSKPLHIEIYNTMNCLSDPVTLRLVGDSLWNDKFAACIKAEFKAKNWKIEIIKTKK